MAGTPKDKFSTNFLTTPILEAEKSIDWHNIYRNRLEKQKQLIPVSDKDALN